MYVAEWQRDHARRFAGEIGLLEGSAAYTNGELHGAACTLAHAYLRLGAQPGDRVAILAPHGWDLFVAAQAAYHAGMVLTVLPESSPAELSSMLSHCAPRVLVAHESALESVRDSGPGICIATGSASAGADRAPSVRQLVESDTPLIEPVSRAPDDPVQLCYTSGTSSKPKAVVYTQSALAAYLQNRAELIRDPGVTTVMLLAVPSTAFGARFIAMRVISNQRYVLLREFEPEAVLETIERHRVGILPLLPTMAQQLIASPGGQRRDCSSLKVVNIAGAHVSSRVVEGLRARFRTYVVVHYGMTEAGGGIASSETGSVAGNDSVGRILPGVEVRVLDEFGRPVAPGEIGEVVARTPYAGQGYWNDPETSASVFRNGYIHSGDLGRLTSDGELHLVGRIKDVINQGGLKIVPLEVERAIAKLPGVAECVALGIDDELLGEEAVACVQLVDGADLSERAVLEHLDACLDRRKRPGQVLFFERLPKTRIGKPDLRVLKTRVLERRAGGTEPRLAAFESVGPVERRRLLQETVVRALTAIVPQRLDGQGEDFVERSFGEMGLDSIGAVRLAHWLSERLGRRISPTLMYSSPTVPQLCASIEGQIHGRRDADNGTTREGSTREAIAIVGLGCRVPGASNPRTFWKLLEEGRDATSEAPSYRRGQRKSAWRAGFSSEVADFDAAFFRLEASAHNMDPRHRMVLEVAWEACEDAGVDPLALPAERSGVFLGISGEHYRSSDPLGTAPGMCIGYLCRFLDLQGPALSIDTTCSSSLVAVHSAVTSLRMQECDVAIVGGVSVLSGSEQGRELGVVSPEGRTRAFDSRANGFGEGEGCTLLVLKRLSTALADEDRIYATILGAAINHDGRSSSLVAPNPRSQAAVVRQALRNASQEAQSVQYVEAHGTATILGDRIEVESLASVFSGRETAAVAIGSVKSNIGHLEAAAGATGLMKVALSIAEGRLPPSIHCDSPAATIAWDKLPIRVQKQLTDWPGERIAGVSSFGMSGTNAHVIVGESPPAAFLPPGDPVEPAQEPAAWVLPLSAKSASSLRQIASRWADALERDLRHVSCHDIAYTAACRRSHFRNRAVAVGCSREEWIAQLRQIASGDGVSRATASAPGAARGLVMAFADQGAEWPGMGSELFDREPVFRDALKRCADLIDREVGWRLIEEIRRDSDSSRLRSAEIAQPALFAVQVALYELWKSRGVAPAAVVGHGLGEVCAAFVAGMLTLEQAVRVVCVRGEIMQQPTAAAQIRMISSVTGMPMRHLDAQYWKVQFRAPVRFLEATHRLIGEGYRAFLEVGPRPMLVTSIRAAAHEPVAAIASLDRGLPELQAIAVASGELYCAGIDIEWRAHHRVSRRVVDLPTYAWDHAQYWSNQSTPQDLSAHSVQVADEAPGASVLEQRLRTLVAAFAHTAPSAIPTEKSLAALGIDSLGLIEMRSRIARELGIALPVSSLQSDLTFGELLAQSQNGHARITVAPAHETSGFRWLRSQGEDPLHIWVHAVGGGADCYRALADTLSRRAAAFEMVAPPDSRAHTVESLAARYTDALLTRKLSRPVVLVGWSFGGLVAYEMAIQLHRRGLGQPDVVLLDSYVLSSTPPDAQFPFGLPAADDTLSSRVRTLQGCLGDQWLRSSATERSLTPEDLEAQEVDRLYSIVAANVSAGREYRPGTYDGAVLSLRSSKHIGSPDEDWRRAAANLTVKAVEGDHFSLLQSPSLGFVAEAMSSGLAR